MSKSIKVLVFSAMCIALASVTSMIKVFEFPTGGSITLASTFFATLPGFFFGPAVGIAAGFAHGILQFFLGPYILTPVQVFIDYGLAFAAFGLSGFFAGQKYGYQKGYIAACIGRWFFAFLSGWIFFGEYAWEGWGALPYSLAYNGAYIGAEALITVVILLIPAVKNGLISVRKMALETR